MKELMVKASLTPAEIAIACDRDQGGIQVPPCPDSGSNVINGITYDRGMPTTTDERLLELYEHGKHNRISRANIVKVSVEMRHRKMPMD
jgi:hypothetical protein